MEGNPIEYFRAALKYMLDKRGYGAQSYYARKAKVNQQYISLIIKGERNASETTRRRIASACGYEYEDFLKFGRELLEGNIASTVEDETAEYNAHGHLNVINGTATHEQIIGQFQHKDWAKRINAMLLEIEKDPEKRDTVERIISTLVDAVRESKKIGNSDK